MSIDFSKLIRTDGWTAEARAEFIEQMEDKYYTKKERIIEKKIISLLSTNQDVFIKDFMEIYADPLQSKYKLLCRDDPFYDNDEKINTIIQLFFEDYFGKEHHKVRERIINKQPEHTQNQIVKEFLYIWLPTHSKINVEKSSFAPYASIDLESTYTTKLNSGGKKPNLDILDNPYGIYS